MLLSFVKDLRTCVLNIKVYIDGSISLLRVVSFSSFSNRSDQQMLFCISLIAVASCRLELTLFMFFFIIRM